MRLRDQHPARLTYDALRFLQYGLDLARVVPDLCAPLHRERARLERVQWDDAPLRLGDDALRHDQNVAVQQWRVLALGCIDDQRCEVVTVLHLWDAGDAEES